MRSDRDTELVEDVDDILGVLVNDGGDLGNIARELYGREYNIKRSVR